MAGNAQAELCSVHSCSIAKAERSSRGRHGRVGGHRGNVLCRHLLKRRGDSTLQGRYKNAIWPGTAGEESKLPVQNRALRKLRNGRPMGAMIADDTARRFTLRRRTGKQEDEATRPARFLRPPDPEGEPSIGRGCRLPTQRRSGSRLYLPMVSRKGLITGLSRIVAVRDAENHQFTY